MSETIKCQCEKCGAKYRLPVEYQGRSARCKKCGEKFKVPAEKTLEDSVLDWLKEADEEETSEESIEQPRVVSMSKDLAEGNQVDQSARAKGPIRMKAKTGDDAE